MPTRNPQGVLAYIARHPGGVSSEGPDVRCGACRSLQHHTEFYMARAYRLVRQGKRVTGTTSRCRSCNRARMKAFMAPKVAVITAARLAGCADCGLKLPEHPEVFDFDHVRGEKLHNIATLSVVGTMAQLLDEIAKCDVVCANCHRIRTGRRAAANRGHDRR